MWIIKIIKIECFHPPRLLNEHWCIYSCLQIPPRENWLQYVRRVYTQLQLIFLALNPWKKCNNFNLFTGRTLLKIFIRREKFFPIHSLLCAQKAPLYLYSRAFFCMVWGGGEGCDFVKLNKMLKFTYLKNWRKEQKCKYSYNHL